MPGLTFAYLDRLFEYHAPNEGQKRAYASLRASAKRFAADILAQTPACADQTAAIRKVREAVMTANAAIACHPAQAPSDDREPEGRPATGWRH